MGVGTATGRKQTDTEHVEHASTFSMNESKHPILSVPKDVNGIENGLTHTKEPIPTIHAKNVSRGEIVQVRNAAFAAAVAKAPLQRWSKESRGLYFFCFITFLCACANGYDGSLMTGILAMTPYLSKFGTGTTGSGVSLVFSMYSVGSLVGSFPAAFVADKFGRKAGMWMGAGFIILGMIIASSAQTFGQLVGGRFVLGWGISIMNLAAPAYCMEIAPPQWRGRMTGVLNCGYYGGSISAAAITFGTNYIHNDYAWRIPLIGQAVPALAVIIALFFMPESPRWLLANGKKEEALALLVKYHGNRDTNSAVVALEWREWEEGIALDASDKVWWDYRALFNSRNHCWRFTMVMFMSVFGQFSGGGLGYFNTVIYASLGYTDSVTQLGLNLGAQFVSAFCALSGAALTDYMPRIKILTFGTLGQAAFLAINAALSLKWAQQPTDALGNVINPNLALGKGALASYYLFNGLNSFTYTPLQAVYPAENLETTTRAKGLAFSGVIAGLIGFINTYAGPIGLHNIKNNYIWVFVGWDCVEAALWYLCGVETQGRTLEELDYVYDQSYPPFASRRKQLITKKGDEIAIVQGEADA